MDWPPLLAYITGTVDQELLLCHEYLVAENRIFKAQIQGRLNRKGTEKGTEKGQIWLLVYFPSR